MNRSEAAAHEDQWQSLGTYLQTDNSLLLPDQDRLEFLGQWNDICEQQEKLDDALLIGLIGGTGVGKSTFINALAGEEISRSSDRRPTTDRIVVYRHRDTELPLDVPLDDVSQPQVLHSKGELSKAIIFDFPDFDSAERAHHDIIKRYVEFLDVMLIVVDDVKYADRRLYELLSSIHLDEANLFILFNKIDRLKNRYDEQTDTVVAELLVDVRQKMADNAALTIAADQAFPLAAKQVMEDRIAGRDDPDCSYATTFRRVESLLESFQQDKRRRAAKERNIDSLQVKLADSLADRALGQDNESILDETSAMIASWRMQIDDTLRGIPVEVLSERDRRGLSRQRLRRAGAHWGLPFSLLFTLLFELRRGKFQAPSAELSAMGGRIFQHYRGFLEAISNLRARLESEVVGSTIEEALNEAAIEPVDQVIDKARLSDELASDFQRNLQSNDRKPRVVSRMACHIPAIVTLVLAVWSRVYPILASISGESERGLISSTLGAVVGTLSPTFVIGTIMGVVFVYALTGMFIWLREVQMMEADIHKAELAVRKVVAARGGQAVNEMDQRIQSLKSEFEQLRQLLR